MSGTSASTSARQMHHPPQHVAPLEGYDVDPWSAPASALPMQNMIPTFDLLTASETDSHSSPRPLDVLLIGENREIDVDLLGPTGNPSVSAVTGLWRRHSVGSMPSPTTSLAESYSYTVDSLSVDGASGSSRSISRLSGSTGNGSSSSSSGYSKSSRATSFRTRSTPSALSLVGPWRANLLSEASSRSSNGLRLYDLNEEELGDEDASSGRPLLSAVEPVSPAPGPRIVGGHSFSAAARFANRPHAPAEDLPHTDHLGPEQWSVPSPIGTSASGAQGLRRAATSTRRRLVVANAAPTDRFSSGTLDSLPGVPHPQSSLPGPMAGAEGSSLRRIATVAAASNLPQDAPAVPSLPATAADRRVPPTVPRRVLFVANSGPSDRGRRGGGNGSSSGSSSGRSRRSTWSSASSGAAR